MTTARLSVSNSDPRESDLPLSGPAFGNPSLRVADPAIARLEDARTRRDDQLDDAGSRRSELSYAGSDAARLAPREARFIGEAAHELAGNVTGIALQAAALAERVRDLSEHELQDRLRGLAARADRLQVLAKQLLDLSRLETGARPLDARPVEVGELLREMLSGQVPRDDQEVELHLDDDLTIISDPVALEQILTNLLRNAYRHGGRHIVVEGQIVDERIVLTVVDDGPGVPDDRLPDLFEPFTRGSVEGAGLGLAIVEQLARALDGEVGYRPNRPHGACFTVTLPAS